MNHEEIRHYCLQKTGCTEGLPFDDQTLVFKVGGKMFAVLALDESLIALKAKPDEVAKRLEHYREAIPARYFDKRHWHAVDFENFSKKQLLRQWIDQSYELVVESLPKKIRTNLQSR